MSRLRRSFIFTSIFTVIIALLVPGRADSQSAGGLLYVPNGGSNNVSIYTINAGGTLTNAGTLATGAFPQYMAVRGDQAFAYVANRDDVSQGAQNRTVSVINTKTQTVGQTVTVSAASDVLGVAVTPDGAKVYVAATASLTHTVRVFSADATTGQLTPLTSIDLGRIGPRGVAMSSNGLRLYVVNQTAATVSIINTATDAVDFTVAIGGQPLNIALSPDGTLAYVSDFTSFTGGPSNKISVIDTTTSPPVVVTSAIATGAGPDGIAVTPDGNYLYTANQSSQTVSQFIAVSPFTSFAPGIGSAGSPVGIVVSPQGTFLYTTNGAANTVGMYIITGAGTGALVANGTIASGTQPNYPAMCGNGNGMLATGLTFVANTAGAAGCTGPSPAFTGGTMKMNGAGLTIPESFTLGTGGGTIDTNGNTAAFSGVFSGTGGLTKVGAGTLTLTGANNYSGTTTVNAGTLQAGNFGAFSSSSATTVSTGATLDLNSFNQTVGSLAGSGTVSLGGTTLTAGGDNTTTAFSGGITGTGGVTKTGTGTLTLSGTNAYTGATTVSGGMLLVNGSLALGSTVTVASGAAIGGTGTISGNVVILPGGRLLPGVIINGTITAAATSTSVAPSVGTVTLGTSQTFTATVTSGGVAVVDGSVTFTDTTTSTTLASNVALNGSGQAATTVTLAAAGGQTIQATYNADTGHLGSSNTTSVTVNKANQTITFGALGGKTYGNAAFGVSATATSTLSVTFSSSTAGVCTVSGSTVTIVGAGTCTIAADQAGNGNFNAAPQVPQSFTVSKVALTVSADTITITYGAAPSFTATITGFVNSETAAAVVTGASSLTSNATLTNGNPNAGFWTITPAIGTLSAANYTFTVFSTGSLTVNKAGLTVTADPQTITYGAAPAPTATITGLVNGDAPTIVTGTASFSNNATLTNGKPNAGSWTITPAAGTLSASNNYSFATFSTGTLTVNKAALTVTADPQTITYGAAPAFTATLSNFVNGDAPAVVGGAASFANNAILTNGKPNAGSWTITPAAGTLSAANYSFGTFNTGILTVNKVALTATADPQTITYGAAPAFTVTLSNFVNGDTSAVVGGAAVFTNTATLTNGQPNAGSWTITPAIGTLAAINYTFTTFSTGTLTVNKAVLTVTASGGSRQSGVANPPFSATITGFVNGDTSAVVTGSASLTTAATISSPPGAYTVVAAAGTLAAANYTFTFTNATLTVTDVNPQPSITSVSPPYFVAMGQPATLVIHGDSFLSISVVQVNGANRPASFVSSSQLTVTLSAADLSAAGTLFVTVSTPAPGGGAAGISVNVVNLKDVLLIPVGEGVTVRQSAGTSPSLVTGFVGILPQPGMSVPPAFARWSYRNNGVLVSEATVPAAAPVLSGRIYAAVNGLADTGIAIANPNSQPVSFSFFFTDQTGGYFGFGSVSIPANGQLARFLSQPPFNAPAGTEGTLSFSATMPVGVVALRGLSNSRGDFLVTTLPVSDISSTPPNTAVTVPQFTDGGGWTTSLLLVNSTSSLTSGTVQFIDRTSGQPIAINVNGVISTSFAYSLPAGSSRRLSTSGSPAAVTTGSIRIAPATGNAAPSAVAVFSFQLNGVVVSESGMSGLASGASFQTLAESTGNFSSGAPLSAESGIAIANTSSSAVSVNLAFTFLNGAPSTLKGSLLVPAQGQSASFLSQIPGFQNLPSPLQGILRISSADGTQSLAVSTIHGIYNERGDFLFSSTPLIPNTPLPLDTEAIIPHFVDGGGYTTSFIFLNNSTTPASVFLRMEAPSGQPVQLPLN